MKLHARWLIYAVVLLGLSAVALWQRADRDSRDRSAQESVVSGEPIADIATRVATPDPMQLSKWLASRAKRYRALFQGWQCDVLVAPMQVEAMAFDRPTRYLMSADIAHALASDGGCVADPLLVDIALGEGLRGHPADEIRSLARDLKAKTIVTSFAGHNKSGQMRVTLQVERRKDPDASFASSAKKSFDNSYTLEVSPFEAFHRQLPQMLADVGLKASTAAPTDAGKLPDSLPSSPSDVAKSDASAPLLRAAQLMMLGILAPRNDSPAGERLFAKALLAVADAKPDDTVLRLRARALLHLKQRPYALKLLSAAQGAEADGLRSVLNGDLPAAHAALDKVREPWDYMFLSIETYDIEAHYKDKADELAQRALASLGADWKPLASMRLVDSDEWRTPDLAALKGSLDAAFPIKGQSLKEQLTSSFITGKFDESSTYDLLASRHVRALLDSRPHEFCCSSSGSPSASWDLLDLFDARAEAALVERAAFYARIQGKPEYALKLLDEYGDVLAGQPAAEVTRAYAEWQILQNGNLQNAEQRKERMHAAARIALLAEPGQEYPPVAALWYAQQPPADTYAHALGDAYCEDFPMRADWPGIPETSQARLDFASINIKPLQELISRANPERRKSLLTELDHRFVGNREATKLRLENPPDNHELGPADVKAAIAGDLENWSLYEKLAQMYIANGDYLEASRLAQSFPPFSRDAQQTVGLSNDAEEIGTNLYYSGAFDAARPLLKIAADYENGSSASNRSRARLAVLDGDYSTAAMTFLGNAQHYQSRSDFRDFLSLLFAGGESETAWQGFNQLVWQLQGPQLWAAALVGHRRDNISQDDLRKWLLEKAHAPERSKDDDSVIAYALAEQLTDRAAPSQGFPEFVATLSKPSGKNADADGKSSEVPGRYALFAQAYTKLRESEFEKASELFNDLASHYNIESNTEWGFALPYYAFAAVQSGDKFGLEKHVDSKPAANDQWGILLAKAVFEGMHDRPDKAAESLDKAFRKRIATGKWPVSTSYQYAEVCVWLYEHKKDDRYRQHALNWARAHERIEPTHAWAYALVARFGDDPKEQTQALAKALYLDPQSNWASGTSKELRDSTAAKFPKDHVFFPLHAPGTENRHL